MLIHANHGFILLIFYFFILLFYILILLHLNNDYRLVHMNHAIHVFDLFVCEFV